MWFRGFVKPGRAWLQPGVFPCQEGGGLAKLFTVHATRELDCESGTLSPSRFGAPLIPFGGAVTQLAGAQFVVLPVPYDLTTSYEAGARWGPDAILRASVQLELYDEETGIDLGEMAVATSPPLEPVASGPEEMLQVVEDVHREHLTQGRHVLMLGGEHSLTIGALRAHKGLGRTLDVLQLDAHSDLRPSYQGSPYSHACTMARAAEIYPIAQAGLRSMSREELARLQPGRVVWARDIHADLEGSLRKLDALLGPTVYITIDLDVLDPALMPAVGTPEPGGLDWFSLTRILRHIGSTRTVAGVDIMEHAPRPGLHAPDFVAARLAAKSLAYCWGGRAPP
ncbi:MAG: agmatinase [Candidatus Eisenbacteria bacterium]|nr:agmatinase [Candidatus Eisenbacteria bacterium]